MTSPTRHGYDTETMSALLKGLRTFIRTDPSPTKRQWEAIGEALWQGDPLADDVVLWMEHVGMKHGMAQFKRANQGTLTGDTPEILRRYFMAHQSPPGWISWDAIEHGVRVFHRAGRAAYDILRNVSLMGGYQAAGLNPPLIMTGALEDGTPRRIAKTMQWVMDCTTPRGLRPGERGHRETHHIRLVHALIRRKLTQDPNWHHAHLGTPLNQPDMALTYMGFSVVFLLGLRLMGVPLSEDDASGVMHLWSYACWLMGVDPQWLREDEYEGRHLMYQLTLAQLPPDETTRRLGHALMKNAETLPYDSHFERQLTQAQHLSVTRLFVGEQGMRNLGLPTQTIPWYPVLTALPRRLQHLMHRRNPIRLRAFEAAGRAKQEQLMARHLQSTKTQ